MKGFIIMRKIYLLVSLLLISIVFNGCFGPGVSDYSYDLVGGYKVTSSSAHEVKVVPQSSVGIPMIPAKVIEIAWDNTFILAKQQGLKKQSENSSYMIPDEKTIHYWIINASQHKIYGPLDDDEFIKERKKLNVSDSLKLKNVDSYKKSK